MAMSWRMQSFSHTFTVRPDTFCRPLSELSVAIPITHAKINPACLKQDGDLQRKRICALSAACSHSRCPHPCEGAKDAAFFSFRA